MEQAPAPEFGSLLLGRCASAPPMGPGICPTCRAPAAPGVASTTPGVGSAAPGGASAGRPLCLACRRVARQLGVAPSPVVPVAVGPAAVEPGEVRLPRRVGARPIREEIYSALRHVKWRLPPAELDPYRSALAALLASFLSFHAACIAAVAGGPFDLITHVPTSKGRRGTHPLRAVLETPPLDGVPHRELLAPGAACLSHYEANSSVFAVTDPAAAGGRRILLVDDTYASGSRAQSAAAALRRVGASVLVVTLLRVVDPERDAVHRRYWRAVAGRPWDVEACCLEDQGATDDRSANPEGSWRPMLACSNKPPPRCCLPSPPV